MTKCEHIWIEIETPTTYTIKCKLCRHIKLIKSKHKSKSTVNAGYTNSKDNG